MVEMKPNERLNQQLMIARVIGASIMVSLVILAGVVEFFIANRVAMVGLLDQESVNILRQVGIAVALILVYFNGKWRSHRLGKDRPFANGVAMAMIPQERYRVLMQTALITYGLVDAIAMLGFFLFLLSGERGDYYLMAGIAVVMLVYYFPRQQQWARWYASGDKVR